MTLKEIFKDNEGYKFSKAAALTGYPTTGKDNEIPVAIYADNTIVGFIMLGYYEDRNQFTLWKFMIDKRIGRVLCIWKKRMKIQ